MGLCLEKNIFIPLYCIENTTKPPMSKLNFERKCPFNKQICMFCKQ